MTSASRSSDDVYAQLAEQFSQNYARGRRIVFVDGFADTAAFADALGRVLAGDEAVTRASIAVVDPADADRLRSEIIAPYRAQTEPADAVLLVDGAGLLSDATRGAANFSIWLDAAPDVLATRPGRSPEQPYTDREFRYLREASPLRAAMVLVDVSDPSAPHQIYRDFC